MTDKHTGGEWYAYERDGKPLQLRARVSDDTDLLICTGVSDNPTPRMRADFALIESAPNLLTALLEVEWVEVPTTGPAEMEICPWCLSARREGHTGDCSRQAAIAKAWEEVERCES